MDSTEKRQQNSGLFAEIFRFLLVGGLATVCDYAVYLLFRKVILSPDLFVGSDGWNACSAILATTFGFITGLLINWVLSVIFVFTGGEKRVGVRDKKAFFIFTVIALIGLVFTQIAVGVGVLLVPTFTLFGVETFLSLGWNEWFLKGVTTCIVLVFNYWARKKYIFRSQNG